MRTNIDIDDALMAEAQKASGQSTLQGLASERAARDVEALLRRFDIAPVVGDVDAARNFRALRRRGITIRKTIDLLIGTWCIETHVRLLHNDGDFRPMARHLGLIEVPMPA